MKICHVNMLSFLKQRVRNPLKYTILIAVSCWCLIRNPRIGSCTLGIETPQPFTSLDVIGAFFLPFDASMDIFHGKFNLGKVRSHALHQIPAVKVSCVTASIIFINANFYRRHFLFIAYFNSAGTTCVYKGSPP